MTAAYVAAYLLHIFRDISRGYTINPVKLLFIAASYFLWYFTSWHTDSILVFGIAHRIMHGLQYIVIVYWFIRRKTESERERPAVSSLVQPGHWLRFCVACLIYAVAFQLLSGQPLERFGFGVVNFGAQARLSGDYHVYAEAVFSIVAFTHFYFDSFIWKVRETTTQGGL